MARDIYSWKGGTGKVPFKQHADGHWEMLNYFVWYSPTTLPTTWDRYIGWDKETRRGITEPLPMEWRDKYTFQASLRAVKTERGRSASNVIVADKDGNTYVMTVEEFVAATHEGFEPGGYITASWTFVKRGANYHLVLAEDTETT